MVDYLEQAYLNEKQEASMAKKLVFILSMFALVGGLTACNTMHGFGQDVERGGEKIQKSSDDVKK